MGKHHGQNNIVRGWGGEQFVQVLQCLMKASLLENGRICLKRFFQGCSYQHVREEWLCKSMAKTLLLKKNVQYLFASKKISKSRDCVFVKQFHSMELFRGMIV